MKGYRSLQQPEAMQLSQYVDSPLWGVLNRWVQEAYEVGPLIEHSSCSMAAGWNIKYRRGSRALCTLYPDRGKFTCLVSIGRKETPAAELLLPTFTQYTQELWQRTALFNGGRWLMLEVTDDGILEGAKMLISMRRKPDHL